MHALYYRPFYAVTDRSIKPVVIAQDVLFPLAETDQSWLLIVKLVRLPYFLDAIIWSRHWRTIWLADWPLQTVYHAGRVEGVLRLAVPSVNLGYDQVHAGSAGNDPVDMASNQRGEVCMLYSVV